MKGVFEDDMIYHYEEFQIESLDLFSDSDSHSESCDADISYQCGDIESNLQDITGTHMKLKNYTIYC